MDVLHVFEDIDRDNNQSSRVLGQISVLHQLCSQLQAVSASMPSESPKIDRRIPIFQDSSGSIVPRLCKISRVFAKTHVMRGSRWILISTHTT